MPKKRAATRSPEPRLDESALSTIVRDIAQAVRSEGVLPRARLPRLGVPKAQVPEVLDGLRREGVDVTAKNLRVPVAEQLAARLAEGAALPLKSLASAVAGATKPETLAAAGELVKGERARWVVRTKEVVLAAASADVLPAADVEALERVLGELAAALKLARKHRADLLRADVGAALSRFARTDATRAGGRAAATEDPVGKHDLAALIDEHSDRDGLTFVPTLVRVLGGAPARDALHSELLQGARAGLFELRPESGMGRLSAEDLSFCIPGPQGSRLSWIRRRSQPATDS